MYHRKKRVKQQRPLHMSSQYGELWPINGWARFTSLGHPSKFQRVSRVGFVTAPTSLNEDQQNFAQCLAVSWAGTVYVHFGGSCPLTEFCQVQNSLCAQVWRCPVLAALLHDTPAAGVSQPLWRGTRNWNYGTFAPRHFQQRALPIFRGRSSRWA